MNGDVVARAGPSTGSRLRRLAGLFATAATLVAAAGWFVVLRPQALGGSVAYVMVAWESMKPTLRDGDLVIVRRQESYGLGDIVAFRVPEGEVGAGGVVIHRIIGSTHDGYAIKGDNKQATDLWRPRPEDVVGRMWLMLPHGGRWLAWLRSPLVIGAIAGAVAFMVMATSGSNGSASPPGRVPNSLPPPGRPPRR